VDRLGMTPIFRKMWPSKFNQVSPNQVDATSFPHHIFRNAVGGHSDQYTCVKQTLQKNCETRRAPKYRPRPFDSLD